MKHWIQAFRLHTLPLALGCIALGSFLAAQWENFEALICTFAILTATFLQILSNLANDYGDTLHGADTEERQGPKRGMQSGTITKQQMRVAIGIFIGLSLASGIALLLFSLPIIGWINLAVMLGLGVLAIIAAIAYTATKKPYGYRGLGDFSVFLFFGLLGVIGTFFIQAGFIPFEIFFPAAAFGFFSAGVLNINNLRDIETDKAAGKHTLAVKLGRKATRWYHTFLIITGILCAFIYAWWYYDQWYHYLALVIFVPFAVHLSHLFKAGSPAEIAPLLKQLVILSVLFAIIYGSSFIWP